MTCFLLIGQGFDNREVHLSAWLYPGYLAGDFRPVPELVEFTSGPAMKRTALCFVVAPGLDPKLREALHQPAIAAVLPGDVRAIV